MRVESEDPNASRVFALQSTDWNREWMRVHASRPTPGDATYWDRRAATFDNDAALGDYHRAFLALADVRPSDSVFDMGCGTGSLCLSYARQGHDVLGADFSNGMLAEARRRAREQGVQGVRFKQMGWDDDWQACGVATGGFDVAIASRSIAIADMAGALAKLGSVARRRCIVTLSTGGSPRIDPRALDACGIPHNDTRDYQYALNILINAGRLPTLGYITSTRVDSFASLDDALRAYRASLPNLTAAQDARLAQWLREELVENERAGEPDDRGGVHGPLRLARPRTFHWALVSWDA